LRPREGELPFGVLAAIALALLDRRLQRTISAQKGAQAGRRPQSDYACVARFYPKCSITYMQHHAYIDAMKPFRLPVDSRLSVKGAQ
jgi:hypothetical protein